ncbi:hypothetical protein MKZ07_00345 [Paenibacillus sp. FSL P4-0338]|uniref:hypothetical protein n=1 Tax=unclassified Paenibacillus TaxID=185978 RepID=UPI0012EBD8C4|nr:hypothetical protein [Paenibacillus sp. FSL R7-269]
MQAKPELMAKKACNDASFALSSGFSCLQRGKIEKLAQLVSATMLKYRTFKGANSNER